MAEPKGITGIGTTFNRSTDGGSTYNPIALVYGISGPSMSREMVEITTYDSVDGYREKIGGLRDAGQLTFTLNFRRSTYMLLKDDFENDDNLNYKVILPDTDKTTLELEGLVTELPMTVPEGDRITVDVTIEISGKVTIGSDT